jgi:baculoviral IAP repeat-containing protein 5
MAKAGFIYAPHSSGDDTAICVYCTTSLSGWDTDDDPLYVDYLV